MAFELSTYVGASISKAAATHWIENHVVKNPDGLWTQFYGANFLLG